MGASGSAAQTRQPEMDVLYKQPDVPMESQVTSEMSHSEVRWQQWLHAHCTHSCLFSTRAVFIHLESHNLRDLNQVPRIKQRWQSKPANTQKQFGANNNKQQKAKPRCLVSSESPGVTVHM